MALRRLIYCLSVVACTVFFLAYQLWFAWFALVALLCLPLFSLLVSLYAMRTARLGLAVSGRTTAGTPQALTLHCHPSFPVPPWRCKVVTERPLTQEKWVLAENDLLPTEHCGVLLFTVQKAKVYDYLGLFSMKIKHEPMYRLQVRPRPLSVRMPALDRFSVRAWKPKWGGGFAENHELRLYRPGDSVQRIHWKLSAKTGSLIFRQPMEPIQNQLLLRLELSGSHEELDRKFGRLLFLSDQLLTRDLHFRLRSLTGQGTKNWTVTDPDSFENAFDALLCCPRVTAQLPADPPASADWQYCIGGGADEE